MSNERRGQIPRYLQQDVHGNYQPEYKKLDIEPMQPGVTRDTPNAAKRNFKIAQPQVGTHSPKRMLSPKHNVPSGRTVPVQIGNHEEQVWMDDSAVGPDGRLTKFKVTANEMIDNNDFVNVEPHPVVAQQTRVSPPQQEQEWDEDIEYASNATPDVDEEPRKINYQANEIIHALNSTMTVGSFVIICNGQVITRTTDESFVKETIQDLVLQSVPVEDIFVCKRLSVNFGVLLDE